MLEHCGITFSWETEFGKGGPILAAKIGPGGPFLAADRFYRYKPLSWFMTSRLDSKQSKCVNCASHCLQLCVIEGFRVML